VAYRLGFDKKDPFYARFFPKLEGVPDGTYEIQDGKAYRVYTLGITKQLPEDHPLYRKDPAHIQQLYNLGIEFLTQYNPSKNHRAHPSRYAYFRDGSLYLLRAPIVHKRDPALISFSYRESQKKLLSTCLHPYLPFEDSGAPLTKEGKLDVDFIRKYGVIVPEKMYLMLGDNHAMSADSRQFGFVPQENLKGGVSFLFSPPGERWGRVSQPEKDHFAFPSLFVLSVASCITIGYVVYRRKTRQSPFLTKQDNYL
jgi:signal peptidase I